LYLRCIFYKSEVHNESIFTGEKTQARQAGIVEIEKLLRTIKFEGFKDPQREWAHDWVYVFHLKDTKTGFEHGKELTPYTVYFLICTDETIGKPLIKQKVQWLNQKVNVYLEGRDVGLTPFMNIAFVTKIELLNLQGKVIKTIQ
jgi:hypothetical protein